MERPLSSILFVRILTVLSSMHDRHIKAKKVLLRTFLWLLPIALLQAESIAQQTNNSSSLTNSAAPSASSVTTGGTNINYQTNNAYQNEVGFGPGIFCRTPTLFVGGNFGQNELNAFDAVTESGNNANNYSVNAGLVVPFGSAANESCKRLAAITVQDREISTQLSMIRACAQLQKEGIRVDPEQFPLLERCTVSVIGQANPTLPQRTLPASPIATPQSRTPLPPKTPQTTRS
jgi:hypothetical protein